MHESELRFYSIFFGATHIASLLEDRISYTRKGFGGLYKIPALAHLCPPYRELEAIWASDDFMPEFSPVRVTELPVLRYTIGSRWGIVGVDGLHEISMAWCDTCRTLYWDHIFLADERGVVSYRNHMRKPRHNDDSPKESIWELVVRALGMMLEIENRRK